MNDEIYEINQALLTDYLDEQLNYKSTSTLELIAEAWDQRNEALSASSPAAQMYGNPEDWK